MNINGKKITYTMVLVAIFVALFLWGVKADAAELRIGLGYSIFNTDGTVTQDLMLTSTDRRWYAQATRIGRSTTFDPLTRFSFGYRVNWRRNTNFSPYLRLGMAHFSAEPIGYISDLTAFDMGVGARLWDLVEVEVQHNSTAGRTDQNEGINIVCLCVVLPFGASR
jgi:hypothetical protein